MGKGHAVHTTSVNWSAGIRIPDPGQASGWAVNDALTYPRMFGSLNASLSCPGSSAGEQEKDALSVREVKHLINYGRLGIVEAAHQNGWTVKCHPQPTPLTRGILPPSKARPSETTFQSCLPVTCPSTGAYQPGDRCGVERGLLTTLCASTTSIAPTRMPRLATDVRTLRSEREPRGRQRHTPALRGVEIYTTITTCSHLHDHHTLP